MRNKLKSTEERLKRLAVLAVQAHKGHTPFKLKDQSVEDDVLVTITQENLNIWEKITLHGKFPIYRKITRINSPPCCDLPLFISILRRKV
jgi:hypothetical protein